MSAPVPVKLRPIDSLSLEERIRRRAFELYVQGGNKPGSELNDWLQAEEEMLRDREAAIDKASEESFPASDPPAH
ncbi:MAG: DUF2934 domain-containing protein [Acidobacteriia bacterium]|nr:DUF2934 domain-containing protein [Terriglobia bacterium]